ncbi:hypothetical protein GCM10027290_32260 [Micromonospora sonneratiae]
MRLDARASIIENQESVDARKNAAKYARHPITQCGQLCKHGPTALLVQIHADPLCLPLPGGEGSGLKVRPLQPAQRVKHTTQRRLI